MKKLLFLTALLGTFLITCKSDSSKVKSSEAQEVSENTADNTIALNNFDAESWLSWRATHLGGLEPRFGKVSLKDATAQIAGDKLTQAKIDLDLSNFTVESFPDDNASMKKLLTHLQSADFFNIAAHPIATFELTNHEAGSGDYNSKITGNLGIMGITKSISFNANIEAGADQVRIQSEKFRIDRRDWDMTYNVEGTAGVPADYIISNDVEFQFDVTLKK